MTFSLEGKKRRGEKRDDQRTLLDFDATVEKTKTSRDSHVSTMSFGSSMKSEGERFDGGGDVAWVGEGGAEDRNEVSFGGFDSTRRSPLTA